MTPATTLQALMDWLELAAAEGRAGSEEREHAAASASLVHGMEGWEVCTFLPRRTLCSWRDFALQGETAAPGVEGGRVSRGRQTLGQLGIEARGALVLVREQRRA